MFRDVFAAEDVFVLPGDGFGEDVFDGVAALVDEVEFEGVAGGECERGGGGVGEEFSGLDHLRGEAGGGGGEEEGVAGFDAGEGEGAVGVGVGGVEGFVGGEGGPALGDEGVFDGVAGSVFDDAGDGEVGG